MTKWQVVSDKSRPEDMFVKDMPQGTVFYPTSGIHEHGGAPMMRIYSDDDSCLSAIVILDGSGLTWTEHGSKPQYKGIPYKVIEIRVTE